MPAVVTCGDPGTPTNGQRELLGQSFGTQVTYTCDVGYELEGNGQRTCQARGQWSGQLPECTRKYHTCTPGLQTSHCCVQ